MKVSRSAIPTYTPISTKPAFGRFFLMGSLWFACLISAVAVVYSAYESRRLTQNLEILRREETGLRVFSGQLMLERSTWAAYSRIEQIATQNLAMSLPESKKNNFKS